MVDRSRVHEGLEPVDGSYPPDRTREEDLGAGLWLTLYDGDGAVNSVPYTHDGKPTVFPPSRASYTVTDAVVTTADGMPLIQVKMSSGPRVIGSGDTFTITIDNTWAIP